MLSSSEDVQYQRKDLTLMRMETTDVLDVLMVSSLNLMGKEDVFLVIRLVHGVHCVIHKDVQVVIRLLKDMLLIKMDTVRIKTVNTVLNMILDCQNVQLVN